MLVRGNEAIVSLLNGDLDAARRAFHEELRLSRAQVVLPMVDEALTGLAAVAAASGELDRAARLLGAAVRYDPDADPYTARLESKYFEPARRSHGAAAWDASARAGAALSFEGAI